MAEQDTSYDPFAPEKYESPTLTAWAKQAAGKDVETLGSLAQMGYGVATIPQRALQGSAEDVQHLGEAGYQPQAVGPATEGAMMTTLGAGAIPSEANSLRTGIGLLAKGKHQGTFRDFVDLGGKETTAEQNYAKTGWYRGEDTKPRYWISDEKSGLGPAVQQHTTGKANIPGGLANGVPLSEVWNHPELYEAYPWLKDIPVHRSSGNASYYDPGTISIHIMDGPPEKIEQALHHEAIHAIQHYEGFANGTNVQQFYPRGYANLKKELSARKQDLHQKIENTVGLDPQQVMSTVRLLENQPELVNPVWKKTVDHLDKTGLLKEIKKINLALDKEHEIDTMAYEKYLKSHGESEARDAPYIKQNPDKLRPGQIPMRVNPDVASSFEKLDVQPPFSRNNILEFARNNMKQGLAAGAGTVGAATMMPTEGEAKPSGDQGQSQMSPGVMKWMMEFLKANPDLAQEMSVRMQKVINTHKMQGGAPGQNTIRPLAQAQPQGPVNGP
jgi:hypothetical protein